MEERSEPGQSGIRKTYAGKLLKWQSYALIAALCAMLCAGCSSLPISVVPADTYREPGEVHEPLREDELRVQASARLLLGQLPDARVNVNGRVFVLDCIGTVAAIYWRMNIDVQKDFALYSGNGVSRLYRSLASRDVVHVDSYPRPGDIVFWDNTWDANGDGNRTNDPLTHAGIVVAVDDDGTIQYIHAHLTRGVVIEVMNLLDPATAFDASGKRINNTMAIATTSGGPRPDRYVSGDVFRQFGDILGAASHYLTAKSSGNF